MGRVIVFSITLIFLITHLAQADEQHRVAVVGSEIIYAHELEPPDQLVAQQKAKLSESEFETWYQNYKPTPLRWKIWHLLQSHILEEQNVGLPTDAEVNSYIEFMEKSKQKQLRELPEQREDVIKKLKSDTLSQEKRESLSQYLKTLESLIEHDRIEQQKESDPEYMAMKKQSMMKILRITIRTWKFNKALYERYGGRVIFQQAGYEPIDAYKALWGEIEQGKYVTILDPKYQDVLQTQKDEFDTYYQIGHLYMNKEIADFYFEIPYWQRSEKEWEQINRTLSQGDPLD